MDKFAAAEPSQSPQSGEGGEGGHRCRVAKVRGGGEAAEGFGPGNPAQPGRDCRDNRRRPGAGRSQDLWVWAEPPEAEVIAVDPPNLVAQPVGKGFGDGAPPPLELVFIPVAGQDSAEDQAVPRTGQPHIEQAVELAARVPAAVLPGPGLGLAVLVTRAEPEEGSVMGPDQARPPGIREGHVRQDDDRGFKPLGAVGGHDPHLVRPGGVHLPGHVDIQPVQVGGIALQVPGPGLFEFQGLLQEHPEGLLGLPAKAGQEPLPLGAPAGAGRLENPDNEVVRRVARPCPGHPPQEVSSLGPVAPAVSGAPLQGVPERRIGAVPCQVEQALVGDVAEWAAQEGGEGQVVAREEGESDQAPQVLEKDVFGQLQPVGTAHGHAAPLQLAQDLVEERAAPADQDQDVAPGRGPSSLRLLVTYGLAPAHDLTDLADHPPGQDPRAGVGSQGVGRVLPGVPRFLLRGRHEVPEVHAPGILAPGLMADDRRRLALHADQGLGPLVPGEDCIHEGQDLRNGPPGPGQVDALEAGAHGGGSLAVMGVLDAQVLGRGTLEGIDRLLDVADDEKGPARTVPPYGLASAREVVARQAPEDSPLVRRGVLRLVHEDVGQPLVQLVQHPGRHGRGPGQGDGPADQVAEVQLPRQGLLGLVGGQVGLGQDEDVEGSLPRHGHAPAHLQPEQAVRLPVEQVDDVREGLQAG